MNVFFQGSELYNLVVTLLANLNQLTVEVLEAVKRENEREKEGD